MPFLIGRGFISTDMRDIADVTLIIVAKIAHRYISLTMLDVIIICLSRIQSYFVSTVAAGVMNLDREKAKR